MPREYTQDEMREMLFKKLRGIIQYWENESRTPDLHGKMEGVVFSVLSMIDGSNADMCGFQLIPFPHTDDKKYCQSHEENWFPESPQYKHDICDGELHSAFLNFKG